jgi:hypothetical protein
MAMTGPDITVSFWLPGTVRRAVDEGGWRADNPRGYGHMMCAAMQRRGRGTRWFVSMRADDANDLADYLFSLADVNVGTPGADTRLASACRDAIRRIEAAVR